MGCEQSIQTYDRNEINKNQQKVKSGNIIPEKQQFIDNVQIVANNQVLQSGNVQQQIILLKNIFKESQLFKHKFIRKNISIYRVKHIKDDEESLYLYDNIKDCVNHNNLEKAQQAANKFFSQGYICQAIYIYQKIIQVNPKYKSNLQGLGSSCYTQKICQTNVYEWYSYHKAQNILEDSVYDALSLCYNIISRMPEYFSFCFNGLNWYKLLLQRNPQNHALLFGYANLLQLNQAYDFALQTYDNVVKLEPKFINAYICKAWIYNAKKSNLTKALQEVKKVQQLKVENPFVDYIIGRSTPAINKKIQVLLQGYQKFPYFPWIIIQLSAAYDQTNPKQYQKAIQNRKIYAQIVPQNFLNYSHISTFYKLLKQPQQQKKWNFKAMQIQSLYWQFYKNRQPEGGFDYPLERFLMMCKAENKSDQLIEKQIEQHKQIKKDLCYWLIGSVFYRLGQYKKTAQWCQKAIKLQPYIQFYWWSLGNAEFMNGNKNSYLKSIQYYLKCIQINPYYYRGYSGAAFAYQQLANLQNKSLNNKKAIQNYQKAAQINPHDVKILQTLGLLEWNSQKARQKNWKQVRIKAAFWFQKIIQVQKYNTKAMLCAGTCYYQIEKFKNAYRMLSMAQKAEPFDTKKQLIPQNLKSQFQYPLKNFQKEGQKWLKIGTVSQMEKKAIQINIKKFQQKVKNISQAQTKQQVTLQKILKPEIIKIIKLLYEDQFKLNNIEQIFEEIEKIFPQQEQYFHILPYLLIIKFRSQAQDWWAYPDIMLIEQQCRELVKKVSKIVYKKQNNQPQTSLSSSQIKLTKCQATKKKVNLFKQNAYFSSYELLYAEIMHINMQSKKSLPLFKELVQTVNTKSNGHLVGISTKIPQEQDEQFRVFIRIMQKMFKQQFKGKDFQRWFIQMIRVYVGSKNSGDQKNLQNSIQAIRQGWIVQIKNILASRFEKNIQTQFQVSDLLRAKCMFNSLEDLEIAVKVCDNICFQHAYQVIQLDNRLSKPQTLDVVYKIQINNSVCQFQLAMKQDESLFHLDHCVYEILRSPFGSLFGSYIYLSKQVNYPFSKNCVDIIKALQQKTDQNSINISKQTQYVLEQLQKWKAEWQKRI